MFIFIVNLIVGIILFAFFLNMIRRVIFICRIRKQKETITLTQNKWWQLCILLLLLTNIFVLVSLVVNYEDFQAFSTIIFAVIAITFTNTNILTLMDNKNIYTLFQTIGMDEIDEIKKESSRGKVSLVLKNGVVKIIYVKNYEGLNRNYKNYKTKKL